MNEVARPMHPRGRTARRAGQRQRQRLPLRTVITREDGLVLLALLIALMLMSIALAGALDVWSLERRREQERQLLFVGDQYRLAILRYYRAGRVLPASIDDLLDDSRFPTPLHHLRRAYPDPVTGKNDWVLMRQGDRFFGIYSSSTDAPIKQAGFSLRYQDFENQKAYGGWRFFYLPPVVRNYTNNGALTAPPKPETTFNPMNSTLPSFNGRSVGGLR
ncbi:type II secretion system protein [Paraburkholderia sp. SIMBA_030]|uniref:type II secretion system protein n=1 Tax=Paraburkholderia sp. SIMBA_030 TaxID=3085773 RepID=UPI0039786936